jgi:hypothetical protein
MTDTQHNGESSTSGLRIATVLWIALKIALLLQFAAAASDFAYEGF